MTTVPNSAPGAAKTGQRRERRGRAFLWLVVCAVIALGALLGLVITALAVGVVFGVGWLSYEGLVRPSVEIQAALLALSWQARLLMAGIWLALTTALSLVLVNLVARRVPSESVVAVLAASTACVLCSLSVTSWAVYFIVRIWLL